MAEMRQLLADRDGWLNLQPAVDPELLDHDPMSVARVFSAKRPGVPLVSWVPGARRRNDKTDPVELGIQHPSGPKAVWRLRDADHAVPKGWRVLADHPRRGLVLNVPDDADPGDVLSWTVRATIVLTDIVLPDLWHAGTFRR